MHDCNHETSIVEIAVSVHGKNTYITNTKWPEVKRIKLYVTCYYKSRVVYERCTLENKAQTKAGVATYIAATYVHHN